ncbi:hypothetical protein IFR05_013412 [Cadophora sp. M221]|nr:hypothetical protein IFR05_013412 [Cadophora sp. M221]
MEDTVAKRHDNIGIKAALTAILWICSLADSLRIVAPVACVIWSDPRPSLALVFDTGTSFEELKTAPAGRKNMIPRSAKCPAQDACALDYETVLLVSMQLAVTRSELNQNCKYHTPRLCWPGIFASAIRNRDARSSIFGGTLGQAGSGGVLSSRLQYYQQPAASKYRTGGPTSTLLSHLAQLDQTLEQSRLRMKADRYV